MTPNMRARRDARRREQEADDVRATNFALTNPEKPLSLAEVERRHVLGTLDYASGNRSLTAELLGIDRRTLYRKLAKYEKDAAS